MQAHNNNIEEFLGIQRTVFDVPVYQRNYDWLDTNCEQLFSDIKKVIDTGNEHFLGTICFKSYNSHERSIIDGQQRLTSITLLMKALYDSTSDDDLKDEINDSYIYNSGHSIDNDYLKIKLHLNERDDLVYHIILNNTPGAIKDKLTPQQRSSRVYQNYKLFLHLLADYKDRGGKEVNILDSLGKLTIIELEVQNENPQEIFESLNSTGLDLTNVDLLRNYLLMQFAHKEQTDLYHEYWSKIEDFVGVDNMESFFVDYLVFFKRSDSIQIGGRRSHINERNLYAAFKDFYKTSPGETDFEKTEKIFADMKRCAELYSSLVFTNDEKLDNETDIRRKLYSLLVLNEASNTRCLLLYLLNLKSNGKITDSDYEEAVNAISSFTFRSRVVNGKGFTRQFAGNVMIRLEGISSFENFKDQFWQAMTFGKGTSMFPSDEDFILSLVKKDMYTTLRSKGTKYLLYEFEEHSPFNKGLPIFDDKTISIEHILPQKLTPAWKTYLGPNDTTNYEDSLHHLGNLALTSYNSEMSNKTFDEKKKIYADSNFYYTRDITHFDRWSLQEIDKRSKELAKLATTIWRLPEQYQNTRAAHESLHTLDEDFSQFTFTKPAHLYISDEEFEVKSWSDFVPTIIRKLKSENEDCLDAIAVSESLPFFVRMNEKASANNPDDFTQIVDDIYYPNKKSAYNTLENSVKLLKEFDKKAGTDMYNNIMFALK